VLRSKNRVELFLYSLSLRAFVACKKCETYLTHIHVLYKPLSVTQMQI
jgi:hypothetical protein